MNSLKRRGHCAALAVLSVLVTASLASSDARAEGFDRWGANDVPVVIMLGQSNTDGRAVYAFEKPGANAGEELKRIHPGGDKPCSISASPKCEVLDLRSIYIDDGKIAGGLHNAQLEFTGAAERAAIGNILKKETDWNSTQDNPKNIVRIYRSHFSRNDHPSGKMVIMQPRITDPDDTRYAFNEVNGNGLWSTKDIFGPEIGLAIKWRTNAKTANRPLIIIKFAVGGTSIDDNGTAYQHWGLRADGVPLAGSLMRPAESVIDDAVAALRAQGKVPRLVGIYWGQGENDRNDSDYSASLKRLMARLRKSTGVSNAQFFIQTIYSGDSNFKNIHAQQIDTCTNDINCTLLSVNDFVSSKDAYLKYPPIGSEQVHYTAHGEMLIGARLFAMLYQNLPTAYAMR